MRKLSISVALALPVPAACAAKNPARSYVAPVSSTTNPLACVMWAASADLGYRASQRGVDEASMKFERGYGRGLRPKADSVLPPVGAGRPGDFIIATRSAYALHLSVVGSDASGREIKPSEDAVRDAQTIIARCVLPNAPTGRT
ncbi:hypothetical protein BH23GEM5_BH23GEM5_05390 [soil metagenome]